MRLQGGVGVRRTPIFAHRRSEVGKRPAPLQSPGARMRPSVLLLLLLLSACHATSRAPTDAHLTHGIAVGEVSSTSAVVWGRCNRDTTLHVHREGADLELSAGVSNATDFTAKIVLAGLAPDTRYTYRVWCGDGRASALAGAFRTAPDPALPRPVHFAWGGDVGGQNVCRDRRLGYPIFARIAALRLDFFIGLGDMIYADDVCLP